MRSRAALGRLWALIVAFGLALGAFGPSYALAQVRALPPPLPGGALGGAPMSPPTLNTYPTPALRPTLSPLITPGQSPRPAPPPDIMPTGPGGQGRAERERLRAIDAWVKNECAKFLKPSLFDDCTQESNLILIDPERNPSGGASPLMASLFEGGAAEAERRVRRVVVNVKKGLNRPRVVGGRAARHDSIEDLHENGHDISIDCSQPGPEPLLDMQRALAEPNNAEALAEFERALRPNAAPDAGGRPTNAYLGSVAVVAAALGLAAWAQRRAKRADLAHPSPR